MNNLNAHYVNETALETWTSHLRSTHFGKDFLHARSINKKTHATRSEGACNGHTAAHQNRKRSPSASSNLQCGFNCYRLATLTWHNLSMGQTNKQANHKSTNHQMDRTQAIGYLYNSLTKAAVKQRWWWGVRRQFLAVCRAEWESRHRKQEKAEGCDEVPPHTKQQCISRESNPGHIDGDDVFYH